MAYVVIGSTSIKYRGTVYTPGEEVPVREDDRDNLIERELIAEGGETPSAITEPEPVAEGSPVKPWTFTEEQLEDRDLDEVNLMIHERAEEFGQEIEPFDELEEALAWASKDL